MHKHELMSAEQREAIDFVEGIAFRTADDGLQDSFSLASGLFCPPGESKTKQADRDLADINKIVERHTMLPQFMNVAGMAEVDYDMDGVDRINAVHEADRLYANGPLGQRFGAQYPTWQLFMDALARGVIVLEEQAPKSPAGSSGGDSGASASDSAPA